MRKLLALALLALALTGGVVVVASFDAKPALACAGLRLLKTPPIGATTMKKLLALALIALVLAGGVAVVTTMTAAPALAGCPNGNC